MDIEELLVIFEKTKAGRIEKLKDNFYKELKNKITELERRKNEVSEDEAIRIEDEIKTLKRIQKKVFEARTGKIIKAAWAKVCGIESENLENLTQPEKELFGKLVNVIEEFKRYVFEPEFDKESAKEKQKIDYIMVRVLSDVPEFEGIDGRVYKLKKEDIAVIPVLNAEILEKAKLAERINVSELVKS